MNKPVLVILAAGMGSRYGGMKQMDSMDAQGHKIIDFSMYDAKRAGFEKVVFIIKHAIEKDFKELVGNRVAKFMEVEYVFQEVDKVPDYFEIPSDRVKPWGTSHALSMCKDVVDGPFMVINADDFYGKSGYKIMYDFLTSTADKQDEFAMVAYELGKTLTDKGSVTRGVCARSEEGYLTHIVEESNLVRTEDGAAVSRDDGKTFTPIDPKTPVSMNMWGFKPGIFAQLDDALDTFFKEKVATNPVKAEALLPNDIGTMINNGKASVKVLTSPDQWFGVTYPEDKPMVVANIQALKDAGEYPEELWK